MASDRLDSFQIYKVACDLFHEFMDEDSDELMRDDRARALARQQTRSLDSICSNIEEGYGRGFGKEWPQFLRIARGSARESKGRFSRCRRFLAPKVIEERVKVLDRIIGGLTKTIASAERKFIRKK
jgi:four helix bundle protein